MTATKLQRGQWSLIICAILTGCSRDEADVPKYDYGKAAPEAEGTEAASPPTKTLADSFERMDTNDDNMLDTKEFTADYFAAQTVEQYLDIFPILDSDKDGLLTLSEFRTRPARAHFRLHDADDDGALNLREFFVGDMPSASTKQVDDAFALVDRNDDELVQVGEFRDRPLGAWFIRLDANDDGQLSVNEFDTVTPTAFKVLDADSNGQLSLAEFQNRTREFDFAMRDSDDDERLSVTEFVGSTNSPAKAATETEVFQILDRDADESLTLDEFETRSAEVSFRRMDSDNSGELSAAELQQGDMPWASIEYTREALGLLDKDVSGGVSLAELASRSVEAWFVRSDADENGLLSIGEYARVNSHLQPRQCEAVFAALDADLDGQLDLQEFRTRAEKFDFATQDRDGDGRLSVMEFVGTSASPEKEVETDVFNLLDNDADEMLTLQEFKGGSPEVFFRRMDRDGSGELDASEFQQGDMPWASLEQARDVLRILDSDATDGVNISEFSSRPMEAWFIRLDANDDGQLSVNEFDTVTPTAFDVLDADSDDQLSLAEFQNRTHEFEFAMRDGDGDERLSVSEFVGSTNSPAKAATETEVFQILDRDADESLTLEEFEIRSAEVNFRRMDSDNSGELSASELRQGDMPWASIGHSHEVLGLLDKDISGGVSFAELASRSVEAWFVRSDADENGLLSIGEYARVNSHLQPRQCEAVFAALDADLDGQLDLQEFRTRAEEFDFANQDRDGNGRLSVVEFVGTSASPEKEVETDVFNLLDNDADEMLTLQEFKGGSPEVFFRRMDRDGSGELDASEFQQGDMPWASLEQARDVLRILDSDATDGVSFSEFSSRPVESWFVQSDADENESLSFEEYSRVNTHQKPDHRQAVFEALDSNDNGNVGRDEFVNRGPAVAFSVVDFDVSGFLSGEELKKADRSPEENTSAEEMFGTLDRNGDDKISLDEYLQDKK